jgi:hypothetical protein
MNKTFNCLEHNFASSVHDYCPFCKIAADLKKKGDIVLEKGDIFIARAKTAVSNFPQLLLIQGDEGDIGRFHPTIREGDVVSNDDKSVLVRLTFKTLASLQVFKEEVAALSWVKNEKEH